MAKEGSTIGGLMDAFGTSVSMSLQYGVPLEVYVRKFSHMRFEPQGHTKNPDIRIAKSVVDYIFRWLGITFLPGYQEAQNGLSPGEATAAGSQEDEPTEIKPGATKAAGRTVGQEAKAGTGGGGSAAPGAASLTKPAPANGKGQVANGQSGGKPGGNGYEVNTSLLERAGAALPAKSASRNDQFATFQVDAPSCDNCGNITVRNGNCYLCHNCGNSMGCS